MEQSKNCRDSMKREIFINIGIQDSLKDEILQLHTQLQNQILARNVLETALTFTPHVHDHSDKSLITKPTEELIEEISVLEMEVIYLEKYLLSMYRRIFGERSRNVKFENAHESNLGSQVMLDSSIHRCESSLSQPSANSFRTSLPLETLAETSYLYHSLPLTMFKCGVGDTSNSRFSLAEHLDTSILEHDLETPNWVSEEMIKCISTVYYKLADPPIANRDFTLSPIVSCSSSPQEQFDMWSPQHGDNSTFESSLNSNQESKDFSGSYFTMVEVLRVSRDSQSIRSVEHILLKYRSLVSRLEEVDPRTMKHEEKLAFWINVHNSLVMHAFIVYGIPQSSQKRISLILKAAYRIGGKSVSVDKIQNSILGCRLPRPGQWFQFSLFSKISRTSYAMDHPQPLLKFALCSGFHSDPPVRIYTAKRVYQELEIAKEEYLQSNLKVPNDNKILLPKIIESYGKELGLSSATLLEMIEFCSPECLKERFQQVKSGKKIEWIAHDFSFRFLLSRELAK